ISKLSSEYTELLSGAEFDFRGEKLNMPGLAKYQMDDDRDTRRAAWATRWEWFANNREALDRIYHELTQLRHTSAQKLGLNNYIELGYLRMHRVDYGLDDIKSLRKQIVEEVVPLCSELIAHQA